MSDEKILHAARLLDEAWNKEGNCTNQFEQILTFEKEKHVETYVPVVF